MEHFAATLLHSQSLLRASIADLVGRLPQIQLQASVADVPALKRHLAMGHQPHVVLLCWHHTVANDFAALQWLRTHLPNGKLLVLGHQEDAPDLLPAFCAGAHGYLAINHSPELLHTTMQSLLQGACCFPETTWAALRMRMPTSASTEGLRMPSPTHCEFLRHVAAPDCPNYAEVARRMGKSRFAVEKYRRTLFKQYGIKGKGGLVKLAMQLGLV